MSAPTENNATTEHDLLLDYAYDELAADARAGFEAHLAACEACRADVESLKVAVDALPMSAPTVAPPAALKDRLMVEVRREAELLAAAGPAADRPAPPQERRRRFGFSLRAPLAAALAAGALGVGVLIGGVALAVVVRFQDQLAEAAMRVRRH